MTFVENERSADGQRMWRLRLTPSSSVMRFPVEAAGAAGAGLLLAALAADSSGVAAIWASIGLGLIVAGLAYSRTGHVDAYADRLEFRTLFSRRKVPLDEVIAIYLRWKDVDRTGAGYWMDVVGRSRTVHWLEGLPRHTLNYIQDLVAAHPGIALNPTKPWRDRFGVWHGEHFDEDPMEAIRSVRRAFVGPWVVRAVPVAGGYAARWMLASDTGDAIATGPVRETVNAAVNDAAEFVRQAQVRVAEE